MNPLTLMNPLMSGMGQAAGGGFQGSSSASLDSANRFEGGRVNVGGLNVNAPKTDYLKIALIGACVLGAIFLVKK